MPIHVPCPHCGATLAAAESSAGKAVRCGRCQGIVPVPAQAGAAPPVPAPAAVPLPRPSPAQPELPPAPPAGGPIRERADSRLAARSCPACLQPIGLGVAVSLCPRCQSVHHEDCWKGRNGCAMASCGAAIGVVAEPPRTVKACPFCGEAIPIQAQKCPMCREWLQAGRPGTQRVMASAASVGSPNPAFICALLGWGICGLLHPVAWYLGYKYVKDCEMAGVEPEGLGKAAKILGMVGTILMVIAIPCWIMLIFAQNA